MELETLFRSCCQDGQYLDRARLEQLCLGLGITESIEEIFLSLDLDGDGKITFEEFAKGFSDCSGIRPMEIEPVDRTVRGLLEQVRTLQDENASLDFTWNKENQNHHRFLEVVSPEMDSTLHKIEKKIRPKVKDKIEADRKSLQEKLDRELSGLQSQLYIVEQVNDSVHSGTDTRRIEEETRQLRLGLADTQTNVALLRTELTQLRELCEEKCKELASERMKMAEILDEQDCLNRQLEMLSKVRDGISLPKIKFERRGSVIGDYLEGDLRHGDQDILRCSDPESGRNYTLQRFVDDLDSGLSTLRDPSETDPLSDGGDIQEIKMSPTATTKITQDKRVQRPRAPTPPPERKVQQPVSTPRQTLPSDLHSNPERSYKVIFIGDASVGKSTFILRVVRGQFVPGLNSTLGMDFQLKTIAVDGRVVALQLWDTAGQERFRSITQSYFRKADGIVMMYDCTSERSFLNVRHWLDAVDVELFYQVLAKHSNTNQNKRVPILLVANKVDLLPTARRGVPAQEGQRLAQDFQAMFVETSAKTGLNVLASLEQLARAMAEFEDQSLRGSTIHLADKKTRRSCCSL